MFSGRIPASVARTDQARRAARSSWRLEDDASSRKLEDLSSGEFAGMKESTLDAAALENRPSCGLLASCDFNFQFRHHES